MGNRHLEVADLTFYSSVHSDVGASSGTSSGYCILNTKGNGRLRMAERRKLGADTEGPGHFVNAFIDCLLIRCCRWVRDSVFEISRESGPVRLKSGRLTIWRVATNILIKQSRTVDKGWSSFGVGRGANNSSPQNRSINAESLGLGVILW
jgi:hypothetical protein